MQVTLKKINPRIQAFKLVLNLPVSKISDEWSGQFDFSTSFQIQAVWFFQIALQTREMWSEQRWNGYFFLEKSKNRSKQGFRPRFPSTSWDDGVAALSSARYPIEAFFKQKKL